MKKLLFVLFFLFILTGCSGGILSNTDKEINYEAHKVDRFGELMVVGMDCKHHVICYSANSYNSVLSCVHIPNDRTDRLTECG